jgi:hypothetical protein
MQGFHLYYVQRSPEALRDLELGARRAIRYREDILDPNRT